LLLSGVEFIGNIASGSRASKGGGALISGISSTGSFVLNNSKFVNNVVNTGTLVIGKSRDAFQASGGGLYLSSINSLIWDTKSLEFVSNFAEGSGGGATLVGVSCNEIFPSYHVINWTFLNNSANTDGGGLALLESTKVKMVGNTILKHNIARSREIFVPGWRAQWYERTNLIPSDAYRSITRPYQEDILQQLSFSTAKDFDEHWGRGTNFGAHFAGVLRVDTSGVYEIQVRSDDNSVTKIDGAEIIIVGEVGGPCCGTSSRALTLNTNRDYDLTIGYQQGGGGGDIQVTWKGPNVNDDFTLLLGDLSHGVSVPLYSSSRGGGIYVDSPSSVEIQGPGLFEGNTVDGGNGGAIFLDQSQGSNFYHGDAIESRIDLNRLQILRNVARNFTHTTGGLITIGDGQGGGLFALKSQIGNVENSMSVLFAGNIPSGVESLRSSMFLAAPMEQYSDAIVVGHGDFPFPIPLCSPGQFFPSDENNPWGILRDKYEIITGHDVCYTCPVGYSTNKVGSTKCSKCSRGEYQNETGQSKCYLCEMGMFSNASALKQCYDCSAGWATNVVGSTRCSKCSRGEYQNEIGQSKCYSCEMGMFSNTSALKQCYECPAGWATNVVGSTGCSKCQRGKVQGMVSQASCKSCSEGQYSDTSGAITCKLPKPGTIAVGGSSTVQVADGWYRECNKDGVCDVTLPCSIGKYGSKDNNKKDQCIDCPAGWSSFSGSLSCIPCSKGKFAEMPSSPCIDCQPGQFQPQDQVASIKCQDCPSGWKTELGGESSCQDEGYTKPDDCSDAQYLNDTSMDQSAWECEVCPTGGSCRGSVTASTIGPLFGWWPIPSSNHFAECLFHPACPGAPNPKLQGKYLSKDGEDPADLLVRSERHTCAFHLGFRNHSRLCHTCSDGYRRGSAADTCVPCPKNEAANWSLIVIGFFVILSGCLLLVYSAIKSKGKQQVSEMILKIMLNYFQVANMARVFPLHWPSELEALFDFFGAFSTVGGNLLNPDCLSTTTSAAELFYSKQALYACFPFIIIFVSFFMWFIYATCIEKVNFFAKRVTPASSTAKDSFIITVGTFFYLMFPTLIGGAFQLFDCRAIDDPDVKWLYVDLEEQCYVGRHIEMMLLLGVSQLVLYVLGFPLLMLFFLVRNSERLDRHATKHRYGMFYASYKGERYYWEILLSLRKISIVALGVFGPVVGPVRQSQLAQFVLLMCIVGEIIGKPYSEESLRHKILDKLETAVLMVLWGNFGGGTMIYESIEAGDDVSATFVSILMVLLNCAMIGIFVIFYLRALCYENRNTKLVQKVASFHFARRSLGLDEDEDEYDVTSAVVTGGTPDTDVEEDLFGIELGVLNLNIDTVPAMSLTSNPTCNTPGTGKPTAARQNWNKIKTATRAVNALKSYGNSGTKKRIKCLSKVVKAKVVKAKVMEAKVMEVNRIKQKRKSYVTRNMENGDVYYENEESGDTLWDAPPTNADIVDQRDHARGAGIDSRSNDLNEEKMCGYSHQKNPLNTSEDQLPDGWEAAYDDDNGIYFFNEETGERTWEHPLNKTLPAGWEAWYNEDNEVYFFNEETGEASWVEPTA
jgi:hypothetical protein